MDCSIDLLGLSSSVHNNLNHYKSVFIVSTQYKVLLGKYEILKYLHSFTPYCDHLLANMQNSMICRSHGQCEHWNHETYNIGSILVFSNVEVMDIDIMQFLEHEMSWVLTCPTF